jgi:16S rRNA (guanine(966)-N(2))-methyltransferase RsmD
MMRIITGMAKGVKLDAPAGLTTRPTSERAKEAVFSMLQFDIEGRRVLDLFAGSGQMGLEALSRGAQSATLVDQSKEAVGVIRRNAERAKLEKKMILLNQDFRVYLNGKLGAAQPFDLVFLDPPYKQGLLTEALRLLATGGFLKPTSYVVCESGAPGVLSEDPQLQEAYEVVKETKYGVAYVTILQSTGVEG